MSKKDLAVGKASTGSREEKNASPRGGRGVATRFSTSNNKSAPDQKRHPAWSKKKKKRPAFFSFCKGAVKLVGHIYASFDTRAFGQPVFLEVVVALHVKQQLASEDADPFGTRLPLSSNLALSSQLRLQQREVHLQSRRPFPLQFFFFPIPYRFLFLRK